MTWPQENGCKIPTIRVMQLGYPAYPRQETAGQQCLEFNIAWTYKSHIGKNEKRKKLYYFYKVNFKSSSKCSNEALCWNKTSFKTGFDWMYVLNYRGHCLMGQLYESLGELEKAVASYRRYQLLCCCSVTSCLHCLLVYCSCCYYYYSFN